ncbi:uncharacterized protein LOC62_04G005579 [Vanrija pseudolonga]|uniref:Uncharacterized protein n=1 Tax=Vanrija pseudolonga TaxID=143232 RepID=A0AAF1BIX6_9TREE|nr:hypothetical protein LOC62_04G005579 [Vanrija pseudolonga]
MDAVPLIGTIPATVSPEQKADRLRAFWHSGRRILAQLDAFTKRCDRKYEGPSQRWPDLDETTRLAIRDVRRKAVERCENYKYTRRDILDKVFGKNNWDPIETDMVEWREGMANHDPALDLNGGKMAPGPQPARPANESVISYRAVRPMPSRGRLVSRNAHVSTSSGVQRKVIEVPAAAKPYEPSPSPSLPQYGEDEVPLTVQMPGISSPATARESPQRPSIVVGTSTWSQGSLWEESDAVVPRTAIKSIGSDDSLSSDLTA